MAQHPTKSTHTKNINSQFLHSQSKKIENFFMEIIKLRLGFVISLKLSMAQIPLGCDNSDIIPITNKDIRLA